MVLVRLRREMLFPVKRSFTGRHLFAALAWLGLVLAPVAMPATLAASIESAAAKIEMAAGGMPDGMPCCPDDPAKPDRAKDCPFMAVCSGMPFPIAGGSAPAAPVAPLTVIAPRNDTKLTGLAQGPPIRPPKA